MYETITRIVVTFMIAVTILALVIVCSSLMRTLREHYSDFYRAQKRFILAMVTTLAISTACRVAFNLWLTVAGDEFDVLVETSAVENNLSVPLYITAQYFVVDFMSSGVLLLNFGFSIAKNQKVTQSSDAGFQEF